MVTSAADAPRRYGPPPKGRRGQALVRLPEEHLLLYRRRAEEAGMSLSDYVTRELGRAHGLEDPDYLFEWDRRYRPARIAAGG